jgi:hypothetical protein
LADKQQYRAQFAKIADAILNHSLLVIKGPKGNKHYRVSEIEFYFNDY